METDASDFAIGAVLLQDGDDSLLHPVAFESSKLNKAQRNYPCFPGILTDPAVAYEASPSLD